MAKILTPEHKRKIGLSCKGKPAWNKGKKGLWKHTEATIRKLTEARRKRSPVSEETCLKTRGKNHYNWHGGKTEESRKIRNSREMKLWKIAVFERDNYTCIWCGARSKKGASVVLHADHIKPFCDYPQLRLAIDNGRTLCVPFHKTTESYGAKKKA